MLELENGYGYGLDTCWLFGLSPIKEWVLGGLVGEADYRVHAMPLPLPCQM